MGSPAALAQRVGQPKLIVAPADLAFTSWTLGQGALPAECFGQFQPPAPLPAPPETPEENPCGRALRGSLSQSNANAKGCLWEIFPGGQDILET